MGGYVGRMTSEDGLFDSSSVECALLDAVNDIVTGSHTSLKIRRGMGRTGAGVSRRAAVRASLVDSLGRLLTVGC